MHLRVYSVIFTFNFMAASYFGGIAMILNTRNYKLIYNPSLSGLINTLFNKYKYSISMGLKETRKGPRINGTFTRFLFSHFGVGFHENPSE